MGNHEPGLTELVRNNQMRSDCYTDHLRVPPLATGPVNGSSDYSQVDDLAAWYTCVNFGVKTRRSDESGEEQCDGQGYKTILVEIRVQGYLAHKKTHTP